MRSRLNGKPLLGKPKERRKFIISLGIENFCQGGDIGVRNPNPTHRTESVPQKSQDCPRIFLQITSF